MNNLLEKLPSEFREACVTLKQSSYDDTNKQYMTDSDIIVFDFDKIKGEYVKNNINYVNPIPKSSDVLYVTKEGKWIFIEFKNGKIDDRVNFEINKKIYDSLFIIFDLMKDNTEVNFESSISFSRENIDFILVYNSKNAVQTKATKAGIERQKSSLQDSQSRNALKNHFIELGGENFILFGLDQFKGYLFKNVFTYTKEEFEEKFINSIGSE